MTNPNKIISHTIISKGSRASEEYLKSLGYTKTEAHGQSACKPFDAYDKLIKVENRGERGVSAIVTTETITFMAIPSVLEKAISEFEELPKPKPSKDDAFLESYIEEKSILTKPKENRDTIK